MSIRGDFADFATLGRSARLLSSFRHEQTDPARFYGGVAADTAELVRRWVPGGLDGAVIVDVGGGPQFYAEPFEKLGARYLSVEPDSSEMHAGGLELHSSLRGSGTALPIATNSVDVCLSSNVAEHISRPWEMAEEMLRVTRPGGTVVLSYTLWWGPFGGHETGPWHVLGGERAARRYARRHGHEPKNRYGRSLFPIRASQGLRWARTTTGGTLVAAFPRYHPHWAWWCVSIPVVREVAVSNLVLVLRAR